MCPLPFDSRPRASQLFFVSQSKELFSTSNFPVPTASFLEPYLQLNIHARRIKMGPTLSTIKLIRELKIKSPPYDTFGEDPETFKTTYRAASWRPALFRPHLKTKWYSPEEGKHLLPAPSTLSQKNEQHLAKQRLATQHLLGEGRERKEPSQLLKKPHRYSVGKHNQKNRRNGVVVSAGSRQRRLWCSTLPVTQDGSACAAPEGKGVGAGPTLRVLQNQVTCVLHS